MARLVTTSFEIGVGTLISGRVLESQRTVTAGGAVALDPTTFSAAPSRGSYKFTCASGQTALAQPGQGEMNLVGFALNVTYFQRFRLKVDALPTTTTKIMMAVTTFPAPLTSVRLTAAGKLQLWNDVAGTQIGSDSTYTVAPNVWFRLDMATFLNTGTVDTVAARVDGTVFASSGSIALSDAAMGGYQCGIITDPGSTMNLWVDDGALNDSTGAADQSYPADSYVVLLVPTGDSARVGWTGGAGGTTALWDAVNNRPPIGVVNASATDLTQIHDSTANITDAYTATMESYTAAGVPAGATVNSVRALAAIGGSTTAAQSFGLTIVTNPAGAEAVQSGIAAATGTWDTNWGQIFTLVLSAPAVTLGTAPTLKIRQNTNSILVRQVAFMGIVADVTLPVVVARRPKLLVVGQSAMRAATR